MTFSKEISSYFGFLKDAGFRKRSYYIADSMCDESYVFKRRNVKIEIELSEGFDPFDKTNFDPQKEWHFDPQKDFHINVYLDIDGGHESLAYSKLFSPDELENLRKSLLLYEFKDVNRQLEIYADFIKRNLERIIG